MKSTLHPESNKSNPSYIIISVALVQSEIYWICSVLYFVFQSGLATQQSHMNGKDKKSRHRSQSVPTTLSKNVLTSDDHVKLSEEEQELALRSSSLPTPSTIESSIRQRPSIYDEQKGITCPPVWWQKTRVKLGRAPVHGDAKIIVESPKQIESPTNSPSPSSIHFQEPVVSTLAKRRNTVVSATDSVNSPLPLLLSPRLGTFPLSPYPSGSTSIYAISEEDLDFSRPASESSVPDISDHQQQQRVKKFMSKLNTALKNIPHHRRNSSSDSKKTV
ncbi:hypothetical protein [Parasitella parasitica]|uniref:Uncharacterized protein n=1 Tax=Parasitella parasitica TaxID=35722 RepID=A0A0B7NSM5_9FUNG|nr:hypothetical protein [Parasitella parasitica]